MCEALEVSVSGYYAWAARADSPTEQRRRELVDAIEAIHADVKGRYGSPRMTAELRARGYECSENTVAELMREHGIRARAPRRFVRTTDSNHRPPVAANVPDREFEPEGPNERWCADITSVPAREGWLHLAGVEDLFSRMIVGGSMGESTESRLVVDAPEVAVQRRRPEPGLPGHSDRGSPYAGEHHQGALSAGGIVCGMSGVDPCWDNAPVGSFFGRLKCGVEWAPMLATRDQARAEISEYLEVFYNRVRRHSSQGFLSPVEYERAHNPTRR